MRRIVRGACLVLGLLSLLLVSCAPAPSASQEGDTRAASVERLCEESGLTDVQAGELLDLLAELGYTGEVLFAYPATDENDAAYYHIWIGEQTVDAYLDTRGEVISVRQNGVVRYENGAAVPEALPTDTDAEIDMPEEDLPEDAPSEAEPPPTESAASDEPLEPLEPGEPVEPAEPPVEATLSVVKLTDTVAVGEDAWLEAYGRAGETYRIEVHYKSGISKPCASEMPLL